MSLYPMHSLAVLPSVVSTCMLNKQSSFKNAGLYKLIHVRYVYSALLQLLGIGSRQERFIRTHFLRAHSTWNHFREHVSTLYFFANARLSLLLPVQRRKMLNFHHQTAILFCSQYLAFFFFRFLLHMHGFCKKNNRLLTPYPGK